MEFTDDAIDFMKNNDEFVQYYNNYYKDDHHFKSFREMIHERIRLGEIIQNESLYYLPVVSFDIYSSVFLFFIEDKVYSSDPVLASSHQKENIHNKNISQMNSSLLDDTLTAKNTIGTSYSAQTNCETILESSTANTLPGKKLKSLVFVLFKAVSMFSPS
jgi:hypothetical protein